MSCFCFLREGHRELVANNNVLSVYLDISTLTSYICVDGLASKPKDMTSVLLVVVVSPHTGEPRREGLG